MLRSKSEGWPAALLLAGLWLRNVDDPHLAAQEFRGDHHFVADYLSNEVLGSLDDETRSLLLRLSVLGRFTADMCDGVLDRSDSALRVSELERSNLFVTRLERGGWFRMHPLFADFAGFQLASTDPDAAVEIHRGAAASLRAHRRPVEAAEHAAAAGDHELVAQLLVEYHLPLIRSGGAGTLLARYASSRTTMSSASGARGGCRDRRAHGRAVGAGAASSAVARGSRATRPSRALRALRPGGRGDGASRIGRSGRGSRGDPRTACCRHRRGAGGRGPGGRAGGVRPGALSRGRARRGRSAALRAVEHPDSERRHPGHVFAGRRSRSSPPTRGGSPRHASTPRRPSRSWAVPGPAGAGSARTPRLHSGPCSRRRGASAKPSANSRTPSASSVTSSRPSTMRGSSSSSPAFAAAEAVSTMRRRRCARHKRCSPSRTTTDSCPPLAADVEAEIGRARALVAVVGPLEQPSDAERAVLCLLATDLSVRQIAAELFLSPNTVRSHTRAIYRKLGVNSRANAVAAADVLGLLAQPQSPM